MTSEKFGRKGRRECTVEDYGVHHLMAQLLLEWWKMDHDIEDRLDLFTISLSTLSTVVLGRWIYHLVVGAVNAVLLLHWDLEALIVAALEVADREDSEVFEGQEWPFADLSLSWWSAGRGNDRCGGRHLDREELAGS